MTQYLRYRVLNEMPLQQPIYSVIIPTLDRFGSSERALRSALACTGSADIEILIVLNGEQIGPGLQLSDDLKLDTRVRVLHSPEVGAPAARNYGVNHAKADEIVFLDDDCVLATDFFDQLTSLRRSNPHFKAFVANALNPFQKNPYAVFWKAALDLRLNLASARRLGTGFVVDAFGNCFGIEKNTLQSIGGFDASMSGREDRDLLERLAKVGIPVLYFDELKVEHFTRTKFWQVVRQFRWYGLGQDALLKKWHSTPTERALPTSAILQVAMEQSGLSRWQLFPAAWARSLGYRLGLKRVGTQRTFNALVSHLNVMISSFLRSCKAVFT